MPFAVFRVDAGPATGGGHAMRCLTLAEALVDRGWRCGFACNHDAVETVPALSTAGNDLRELDDDLAQQSLSLSGLWPQGADLLVVDHYSLDATYESRCRPWAARILAIDDLADRPHDADLLLDQTLGRSDASYLGRVPAACGLMLGTRYALLRPEFARTRIEVIRQREGRARFEHVLVSLGATDPDNVTGLVLAAIQTSRLPLSVDVILGARSPNHTAVRTRLKALLPAGTLHINPDVKAMIALMRQADMAIGAGGISAWERCCLGLPSIVLVLADNQRDNASALAAAGAAEIVVATPTQLRTQLPDVLNALHRDPERLLAMSLDAGRLCDGQGAHRVVEILTHHSD